MSARMESSNLIKKKICLLGSFGVGKTSLVRRFVFDEFKDNYLSTIGVKVTEKIVAPVLDSNHKPIQYKFLIWDIEGHDKFNTMIRNYYLGASGGIFVADLTRPESVQTLKKTIAVFQEINPRACLTLAANKRDLYEENSEESIKILRQIDNLKIHYLLTSAKTGYNVEKLFYYLANRL